MIFLAKCVRERTWGNLHAVYLSCSTLLCNSPQKVSPLFSQPSFEIISIDREPNELLWLLWNYASKVQKLTSNRRITSNKSRLEKIEFKVGYSLDWDSFGPKYHHHISTSLNVAGEARGFDSRAFFSWIFHCFSASFLLRLDVWPYESIMGIKERVLDRTLRKATIRHSLSVFVAVCLSDYLSDCLLVTFYRLQHGLDQVMN